MIYYADPKFVLFSYEATDKARNDTCKIFKDLGYTPLSMETFSEKNKNVARNDMEPLKKGDILIIQYPTYAGEEYDNEVYKISKEKGIKLLAIVHDLESIRFYNDNSDIKPLNNFEVISLPSEKIKKKLIKQGLKSKVIIQFLWDYLTDDNGSWYDINSDIIFAGNLTEHKTRWIKEVNFPIKVYGDNINNMAFNQNITWMGKHTDLTLSKEINSQIGLLWEEQKEYKDYLKYCLSFKTSLYLASNCPVIAPKNSHVGKIIEDNKLGVTVKDIERETMLKAVVKLKKDLELYQENVSEFGYQIRNGLNMKRLIIEMVNNIEN